MTWTKLSDDFSDDCETLSDAAFRLHVEGLNWSHRKLLDCRIPKGHLRRFAHNPDAATELVSTGWWSDLGEEYRIRHHAVYQRTREQVLAQQAANVKNGRKGGRPPTPKPDENHSLTDSLSENETQRDRPGTGTALREEPTHEVEEAEPTTDPALPHRCKSCSAPTRFRNGTCADCTAAVIASNTKREGALAAGDLDPAFIKRRVG